MRRIEALFLGVLTLILFLGFNPLISQGIHGMQTDTVTQLETVVTGGMETEADVVLDSSLFNDRATEVESITSSIAETPGVGDYESGTRTLTVTNLTVDETRVLTIEYYTILDDVYMAIIGPFLPFLIFGGVIFAIIWGVWKG